MMCYLSIAGDFPTLIDGKTYPDSPFTFYLTIQHLRNIGSERE